MFYQQELRKYLRRISKLPAPPPELSATPSDTDYAICNWTLRGTVGQGASGTVTVARNLLDGQVAAAKMMIRTSINHASIVSEIYMDPEFTGTCDIVPTSQVSYADRSLGLPCETSGSQL
jgi:hypothetical protein